MRLYLTGRVAIEGDARVVDPVSVAGRQGAVALVYLAEVGHRVDRHTVADVLWPYELPDAWDGALSAIVSKLRRAFTRAGVDGKAALPSIHGCYELRLPAGTWVDLHAAIRNLDTGEAAVSRGDGSTAWSAAAVACSVLARPLLPGEEGPWLDQRRRDLSALHVRALDTMAGAWLLRGNTAQAVRAARGAVSLSPLSESSHARLMECQIAAGDRAAAIETYRGLQRSLNDALGISPGAHIEGIYLRALG